MNFIFNVLIAIRFDLQLQLIDLKLTKMNDQYNNMISITK